MRPTIAIIVPVYREARNLLPLFKRLEEVTGTLPRYQWEYILINDGSPDNSLDILRQLAAIDERVKVLDLSRNFGKEIALTAGAHEAKSADAVICIDADLQHPPELIPTLVGKWVEGYDVVVTIRTSIERQPLLKRIGSHVFYWLMGKLSGLPIKSQTTDYRLYDKKVVAAFNQTTERERMFRGIMDWMGFRRVYVEFQADPRTEGAPGYSYRKLVGLALNSITSFSLWPLRLTGLLGLVITMISSLLLAWMLLNFLIKSHFQYTVLAMVVVANTFLTGVVLMAIGLVAIYIGTIHTEVINRPLYVVRERIHFPGGGASP